MPFISKIQRQTDYNSFPPSHPIVIDNGASYFRIGWAGETEPRVVFRNIIQRPRHKITGETVTVVGDHDPSLLRYFDCTRSGPRSAFDSNVVYQFEIMEYILDFGFDRLGANQSEINHPILITECACNPVQSRSKMAELLFESYGVPSVAFGVGVAFSYRYNLQLGICDNNGLAICSSFNTSHVIPFLNGEPVYEACCRANIGGYHITDYLKQLLSLKYPHHISKLTWEKVEDLKMEHCYIALDYASEVRLFQNGDKKAEEKTICWQLPWTPMPIEEPTAPSEDEIARKAALKEKQTQRLRDMAQVKKSIKINDLENEIRDLDLLLQRLGDVSEEDIPFILANTVHASEKDVEAALAKATQSLRKARGEPDESVQKVDTPSTEKFNLVHIPDEDLDFEERKQKRKQVFLKSTSEARQLKKQRQVEEGLEKERLNKLEEQRRLKNPEQYLDEMREKHKDLSEKIEQRKKLKTNGANTNGNNNGSGGGIGRGERVSSSHRERMRLLTTAAFDKGKGDDTFGMKDEDWLLYKQMSKDNDDDDFDKTDPEEAELARLTTRLKEIDPEFILKTDLASISEETPKFKPLTKEDFQITLGVERFRCPEVLFNPNFIGTDQGGLDEMVGTSIRRFQSKDQVLKESLTKSILLTGGSTLFPGMSERLEAGIRMIRPCGTPIKIVKAVDPIYDTWRGASAYAASVRFSQQTFSRRDYYDKGEEWLRGYQIRYSI